MDEKFVVVKLSDRDRGILKTVGDREVVVSVKIQPGADSADNNFLMESLKIVYMQYYNRVAED